MSGIEIVTGVAGCRLHPEKRVSPDYWPVKRDWKSPEETDGLRCESFIAEINLVDSVFGNAQIYVLDLEHTDRNYANYRYWGH